MVNPLSAILATSSKFGAEIDINWELPAGKPENSKVYIFKRSQTDISQAEIDSYFDNIDNLQNYNYNGLFVFDKLKDTYNGLADLWVLADTTYYYKGVIRDEDTGEYSTTIACNTIATSEIVINVPDGKEIVATAIKKMFDFLKDKKGNKVGLGKDIQIIKQYAVLPVSENYVMVERINGSTQHQFLGQVYAKYGTAFVLGTMDADMIRATFCTTAGGDRRDQLANYVRGYKPFLNLIIKKQKIIDCTITIEGDYFNPLVHGENVIGLTVIFALIYENKFKVTDSEITEAIADLIVKNE